ncbi:MAG TPA: SGNH/GDSL hydrolase family protein [Solirubrobacteraceae bacterium]|jgi:lysophospholipase L1-like esterase|nr:SGNH/GDSL hydrolase family protein [Solirubrobacteraceae bacterium]
MGKRGRIIGLTMLCVGVLVPAASAAAAPQYVALGDSYSSGVGTRVFYEESGECSRSPDAFGPKIAAAKGYTLSFQACGGAKTPEVNEKQLGTLSSTTSLVSITIGGNDAGFSNVIINCALYYFSCGSAINEADEFIKNKLPALLETTYKDIRAKATTAQVIVLAYPKLFTKEGATCNVNFLTSGNEKKMNESAEKLDAVIKARAEAMKFTFVNPTSAFEPHAVCASEEWLNGQSNPLSESYHPNVKGQEEFTKLVEAAI